MAPDDFERATRVTYLGAVWGTRAALRYRMPVNRGAIIQVGSALAYRSIPLQSAYCGAKSALRGFTDSLRSELIRQRSNVRLSFLVLSTFNTPQFDWARTAIPRRPRPVGKVFQPEIAAKAIVSAPRHPRRSLYVGWPSLEAVLGNMVLPRFLDRYLARKAWDGQFTDEPVSPDRIDNLNRPVPVNRGAHGRFDDEARSTSWEVALARHRNLLGILTAGTAAVLLMFLARERKFPRALRKSFA